MPCGVRMGDEAEITAPKPLSLLRRPPGCAREESFSTGFGWWDFKSYGCCGGKERCKTWCPSSMAGLSGAFYTSPSPARQVCPQGQPGCATGAAGDKRSGPGWGEQVSFRGHGVHSSPPEQRFQAVGVSWLSCAPAAAKGSPGGRQNLGVSQVDGKCQEPSHRMQVLTSQLVSLPWHPSFSLAGAQ